MAGPKGQPYACLWHRPAIIACDSYLGRRPSLFFYLLKYIYRIYVYIRKCFTVEILLYIKHSRAHRVQNYEFFWHGLYMFCYKLFISPQNSPFYEFTFVIHYCTEDQLNCVIVHFGWLDVLSMNSKKYSNYRNWCFNHPYIDLSKTNNNLWYVHIIQDWLVFSRSE